MDFDSQSMKHRAKLLIKNCGINIFLPGILPAVLCFSAWVLIFFAISKNRPVVLWVSLGLFLLQAFFNFGYAEYILHISREETPSLALAFSFLRERGIVVLCLTLVKPIVVFCMFMLLYIPGIIAYYWFRQMHYTSCDNPKLFIFGVLGKSMKMMRGHKIELFKLDLSFVPQFIAAIFTLGLSDIYFRPFREMIYAEYYDYVKGCATLFENVSN